MIKLKDVIKDAAVEEEPDMADLKTVHKTHKKHQIWGKDDGTAYEFHTKEKCVGVKGIVCLLLWITSCLCC